MKDKAGDAPVDGYGVDCECRNLKWRPEHGPWDFKGHHPRCQEKTKSRDLSGISKHYLDAVRSLKLGVYRHYKGYDYEVRGVALCSETLEPMVVYRALYGDRITWVRSLKEFNESVSFNGEILKRFKRVSEHGK